MPNSLYACKKYQEPVKLVDLLTRKVEMVCATGHMPRDPEVRYSPSGLTICSFSLAVSWGKRDVDQTTEWINCVAFRETAELVSELFHKGSAVTVIGKLAENRWTNREGLEQVSVQVQVWEVAEPVWKKREASGGSGRTGTQGQASESILDDGEQIPF